MTSDENDQPEEYDESHESHDAAAVDEPVPTRLTAHRGEDEEPFRLIRVAKAAGIVDMLAEQPELLLGLHDHKGLLSVNWRSEVDFQTWSETVAIAWQFLDRSEMIDHFIDGKPVVTGEYEPDAYPGDEHTDCLTLLRRAVGR